MARRRQRRNRILIALAAVLVVAVIALAVALLLPRGARKQPAPAVVADVPQAAATEQPAPQLDWNSAGVKAITQAMAQNDALSAAGDLTLRIVDGHAVAFGDNGYGQCDVSGWPQVTRVRAGIWHTAGLTQDGQLVFAGKNDDGECVVETNGRRVMTMDTTATATYAVLEDGTVAMGGIGPAIPLDLEDVRDVAALASADTHLVLLRADGTLQAFGDDLRGECGVADWTDIVMVDCGYTFTVALDAKGVVHYAGNTGYGLAACDGLKDVKAVSAGVNCVLALRKDGTVTAFGDNYSGQLECADWKDVICASAGYDHACAVTKSGAFLAAGKNQAGQLGQQPA